MIPFLTGSLGASWTHTSAAASMHQGIILLTEAGCVLENSKEDLVFST